MTNENINYDMEELFPYYKGKTTSLRLMNTRMGNLDLPKYKPDTVQGAIDTAKRLKAAGCFKVELRVWEMDESAVPDCKSLL